MSGRDDEPRAAFETLAIHAGQEPDPAHGAVMEPIVLATTFAQPTPGQPLRFDYSRSGNPTRAALEACLAALEGGTAGFAFASGCAAATTLLNTLRPGDHIVCGDDVYGGTYRIFTTVLQPLGIATSFVDLRDTARLKAALTARAVLRNEGILAGSSSGTLVAARCAIVGSKAWRSASSRSSATLRQVVQFHARMHGEQHVVGLDRDNSTALVRATRPTFAARCATI